MNHENAVKDIENALGELRRACQRHHIPEPDILRWSDPVKADKAKRVLYSKAAGPDFVKFRVYQPSASYDVNLIGFNLEFV